MTTSKPETAKRQITGRRLLLLLLLPLLGGVGYWLYPAAANRILTLDGEQTWKTKDAPPRRQIIWQPAQPAAVPSLPKAAQASVLRPQLSPDGQTLYLTLRTANHDLDIYQSQLTNDHWEPVTRIEALASSGDDIGPTFSADGATVYFYSDREGGLGGFDLYRSKRTATGWAPPVSLGNRVNTIVDETDPFVSPDGKTIYFSSNQSPNMSNDDQSTRVTRSPDRWTSTLRAAIGFNQYNLFRAQRVSGEAPWGEAAPLTSLNRSDANDGSPYVDPTGSFLYFASDRPQRDGEAKNFDIYRARIRKVGHGAPENLGEGINTPYHELEPALGQRGFEIHFSRSGAETAAARYDLYQSHAIEVEVLEGRDYSQLSSLAAFFRRVVFGLIDLFKVHWWWVGLLLLGAALLASLIWTLRKMSFQRASVPVFFVWAMAIHLILGAGSFYVYFDSDLLKSVKKTFRSMLVASKVPSEELHQSHKPGQEAYEKVADLRSVKTVQTSDVVRQITENPNMAIASDSAIPQLPSRTAVTLASIPRVQIQPLVQEPVNVPQALDRQINVNESIAETTVTINTPEAVDVEVAKLVRPRTETRLDLRTPAEALLPKKMVAPLTPTPVATVTPTPADRIQADAPAVPAGAPPTPLSRQPTEPVEEPAPLQVASLDLPVTVPPVSEKANIVAPSLSIQRADNSLIPSPTNPVDRLTASKSMVRANASRELERQLREEAGPETVIAQATFETPAELAKASPPASATLASKTLAKLVANPTQEPAQSVHLPIPPQPVTLTRRELIPRLLPKPDVTTGVERTAAPQPLQQTPLADTTADNTPVAAATAKKLSKAATSETTTTATRIKTVPLPASEAATTADAAKRPVSIASPVIQLPRATALAIPLPAGDSASLGGPARPSNTRVLIGSVAKEVIDAPLTTSPVATALLRTPARAPKVLYAGDNVGLQALLMLRNYDVEAKQVLIEEYGGSEKTLETVNRSLEWIVSQQHDDGRWRFNKLRDIQGKKPTNVGGIDADAAATAFALLPLLGNGNTHQKGPYKDHVKQGIQWLIKTQQGSGEFQRPKHSQSRMYSHGVAAIALCEAYAMSGDAALKTPSQKAIDFIVKAQHKKLGGWRYQPGDSPDTSVVGWQVMALKSAQMANLAVPAETLRGARRWLDHVSAPGKKLGQFGYNSRTSLKPAMSAEGLLCLQYLDVSRHDPLLEAGARYLSKTLPRAKKESSYYWYYGSQVMFHLQGEHWKRWNNAMKPLLINSQVTEGHEAGSWKPEDQWDKSGGRLLATSLRVLILEVYFRHLPLYKMDN